jgi:hypothetical protein
VKIPAWIYPGAVIRVIGFVGVVLSVDGMSVTVESPKRAIFCQTTLDVLDYALAPQLWQPATVAELIADAAVQMELRDGYKTNPQPVG